MAGVLYIHWASRMDSLGADNSLPAPLTILGTLDYCVVGAPR